MRAYSYYAGDQVLDSYATYRLEDGNLSAFEVVVGLDILAIVAINIRQLR
jgi:hypothetical protein